MQTQHGRATVAITVHLTPENREWLREKAHAERKSQALVLNEVLDAARECRAVMSAEARDMLYQMANEWSGADFAPSRAALTECISHGWIEFAANKAGGRWRAVRITELGRAALGARKEGGGDG